MFEPTNKTNEFDYMCILANLLTLCSVSVTTPLCTISKTSGRVSSDFQTRETFGTTRLSGFHAFGNLMKPDVRVFWNSVLLQRKKISLTHHLNTFSQFKYYISDVKCAWSSKKMCMILSSNCCSLTIVEYSSDNNNLNFGLARDQAVHLETAGNLYTSRPVKKPLK